MIAVVIVFNVIRASMLFVFTLKDKIGENAVKYFRRNFFGEFALIRAFLFVLLNIFVASSTNIGLTRLTTDWLVDDLLANRTDHNVFEELFFVDEKFQFKTFCAVDLGIIHY
jgi:hypothetical protein